MLSIDGAGFSDAWRSIKSNILFMWSISRKARSLIVFTESFCLFNFPGCEMRFYNFREKIHPWIHKMKFHQFLIKSVEASSREILGEIAENIQI